MVPRPIHSLEDNAPALLQLFWNRYGLLPRNLIFVEVVHRKVPYIHDRRYSIQELQPRSAEHGVMLSVTIAFGFMETPNVEGVLEALASHHRIDLSTDPHQWMMHVSTENLLPAKGLSWIGQWRFRLFSLLRQISVPGYYYYGLGDRIQLSVEVLPVRIS
jgi:KUP system potassium uptake protein